MLLLLQQFHLNLNCFQQLRVLALAHKFGVHVHFIVGWNSMIFRPGSILPPHPIQNDRFGYAGLG